MASPSSLLSIVVLVAGVALMLVVHILVVFWALRQGLGSRASSGAEARAEDGGGGGGSQGLSADELDTLTCYDFKEKTGGGGGDCAVCLEAFEDGDRLRRLPRCGHSFHAPCVDSWLRKSRWCPVCRADVVDRPKGEMKLAAEEAPGDVEMAVRRSPASPVTSEIVAER